MKPQAHTGCGCSLATLRAAKEVDGPDDGNSVFQAILGARERRSVQNRQFVSSLMADCRGRSAESTSDWFEANRHARLRGAALGRAIKKFIARGDPYRRPSQPLLEPAQKPIGLFSMDYNLHSLPGDSSGGGFQGDCNATALVKSPYNHWELGTVCGINLGQSRIPDLVSIFGVGRNWRGADFAYLSRVLSADEIVMQREGMVVERSQVIPALLQKFSDRMAAHSPTEYEMAKCVETPDSQPSGLFFAGLFTGPTVLALQAIYAHSVWLDDVGIGPRGGKGYISKTCLGDPQQAGGNSMGELFTTGLRRTANRWKVRLFADLGCGFWWPTIQVGPDSSVTASRDWSGNNAWNPHRTAMMCRGWAAEMQLADYYLWWAWRLLDLAARPSSVEQASRDSALAELCARAALAEICNLAGILVHELSHGPGRWAECQDQACCHYMLEYFFRHRMIAQYGLPVSHMMNSSITDITNGAFGSGAVWSVPTQSPAPVGRFDIVEPWLIEYATGVCPGRGSLERVFEASIKDGSVVVSQTTPSKGLRQKNYTTTLGAAGVTADCLGRHCKFLREEYPIELRYKMFSYCAGIGTGEFNINTQWFNGNWCDDIGEAERKTPLSEIGQAERKEPQPAQIGEAQRKDPRPMEVGDAERKDPRPMEVGDAERKDPRPSPVGEGVRKRASYAQMGADVGRTVLDTMSNQTAGLAAAEFIEPIKPGDCKCSG